MWQKKNHAYAIFSSHMQIEDNEIYSILCKLGTYFAFWNGYKFVIFFACVWVC